MVMEASDRPESAPEPWGKGWKNVLRIRRFRVCSTCALPYAGAGGVHRASEAHRVCRTAVQAGTTPRPRRSYTWLVVPR